MTRDDINLLSYGLCDLIGLKVSTLAAKQKICEARELLDLTNALLNLEAIVNRNESLAEIDRLKDMLKKKADDSSAGDAVAAALAFSKSKKGDGGPGNVGKN